MPNLQSTITEMKSRGIANDLGAEGTGPGGAYEWLTEQSDQFKWGTRATLPGHHITSGIAVFGEERVDFVSLHEDGFDPNDSNDRTEPTADNCTLCLKVINGNSSTFIAMRIAQVLAE